MCCGRGTLSRTAFFRFYLPYALYFGRLVVEPADIGLSAYCARSRAAASRMHPTRGVVWLGKVARHNSRVIPAASNGGKNGRGVIVGCLQQYQLPIGFRPGYKSSGMAAHTP